jgi:acetyl-CoA carboxylase biotin carboxyl carrier protein
MAQKDDDLEKIKEIIDIMKENDLVEVEIKHGEDKIFVKRSQPESARPSIAALPIVAPIPAVAPVSGVAPPSEAGPSQQDVGLIEIKSPLVGTFYAQPSPDSSPYVEVGSRVDTQTVVCIIEAMKVMNEIKAEVAGVITEILVHSGQAVEYGQALFRVRPD